jgi:hypothetical protein
MKRRGSCCNLAIITAIVIRPTFLSVRAPKAKTDHTFAACVVHVTHIKSSWYLAAYASCVQHIDRVEE